MRIIVTLILGGALALTGCDSDEGATGGSGGSAGSGGADGSTPKIVEVSWEAEPDCTQGVTSDVVVTVIATDADTDAADLTYSGSVSGCQDPINAEVSTVRCPNVAPYPGDIVVSDPDGNQTAVAFQIGVCESDACTTEPDTCTE